MDDATVTMRCDLWNVVQACIEAELERLQDSMDTEYLDGDDLELCENAHNDCYSALVAIQTALYGKAL